PAGQDLADREPHREVELVARAGRELGVRLAARDERAAVELDGEVEIFAEAQSLHPGPERAEDAGDAIVQEVRPRPVRVHGDALDGVARDLHRLLELLRALDRPAEAFLLVAQVRAALRVAAPDVLDFDAHVRAAALRLLELAARLLHLELDLRERAQLAAGHEHLELAPALRDLDRKSTRLNSSHL